MAIITNAGGPGIMATDAAVRFGLKLAELTDAPRRSSARRCPPPPRLRNPVDVIGDCPRGSLPVRRAHRARRPNVDMGMVILTPQSMTDIEETAAVVPDAVRGIKKPVVCAFMGAKDVAAGVNILRKAGIPNYPFPEDARPQPGRGRTPGGAARNSPPRDARRSTIWTSRRPRA